jgi:cytochrome c553
MWKLLAAAALIAAVGSPDTARAEGDPEAGRAKAAPCAACHGMDGNSPNPEWPSVAGQHAGYLARQLAAFQSGDRQNVLMTPMAAGLSEQDMADLAAYFAGQQPAAREADPNQVARGQRIYRGGDPERDLPACAACHGPTGRGNPLATWPAIAGQHALYTANTLKAYARGERRTDPNQMMRGVASKLSEADIEALASYLQGLR